MILQMKATCTYTEQYFAVVLFIMLYKDVDLTIKSMDKILPLNESY